MMTMPFLLVTVWPHMERVLTPYNMIDYSSLLLLLLYIRTFLLLLLFGPFSSFIFLSIHFIHASRGYVAF